MKLITGDCKNEFFLGEIFSNYHAKVSGKKFPTEVSHFIANVTLPFYIVKELQYTISVGAINAVSTLNTSRPKFQKDTHTNEH